MSLAKNERVEIPPHCVKVPNGKNVYIHYTLRAYRNEKGQPTSERVSIGKLDPATGLLIPNTRYYELFEKRAPLPMPEYVRDYGVYAAFRGVVEELGLDKLIRKHFHEKAEDILTIAQYMLCEGNVMYYLPDWQEGKMSYSHDTLSASALSRLFAGIDSKSRIAFFNDWIKKRKSQEFIAYDVTSISSYSKGLLNAEWGYNRDKEKLPQVNLGMYYGEESMLPLYYRIYPGSIPDKAHLKYMAEDTGLLNTQKVKFVMDRGFYSAENLRYLVDKNCRFIIALPGSLKYCRDLIDKHRDEIVNRSECYLGPEKPYGKAYDVNELGFRMRVHLYYDPDKAAHDGRLLHEEIARMENELSEMDEPPARSLHYDRYFFINRSSKDGTLSFRRNTAAIDKALSQCGFFLIAETDFRKTTAEILDIYRRRDVVEKSFDDLKNDLDMRRLYVHSDEVAEGKAFVTFLSLIVRSRMQNLLQGYMAQQHFTFQKILLELDKAKLAVSADRLNGCRLLNPPTKFQKDIFSNLGLPLDTLSDAGLVC
jgi:hypothetical protein